MKPTLPKRVHIKHGAYYYVAQNRWTRLCRVSDGLPALYRALADLHAKDVADGTMPMLVARWLREISATRSRKTQANDTYLCRTISEAFQEFRAAEVTPPVVAEFLKEFRPMPRTHNAYRAQMRELMRYAIELGWREAGTNPTDSLRTISIPPRNRYITDSELRRIKVAAMYGDDGKRTRSGPMLCALLDMAYLTGQRISDLLTIQWQDLGRDGILFQPAKVASRTAPKILIAWTPKLEDVVRRLKSFKKRHIHYVFVTQDGQPYTYSGASSAWKRGVARAGVPDAHFHDLRAKAMTDKEDREGMKAAKTMGGHSTEAQTATYVRQKKAQKTTATR
jgi:integrase